MRADVYPPTHMLVTVLHTSQSLQTGWFFTCTQVRVSPSPIDVFDTVALLPNRIEGIVTRPPIWRWWLVQSLLRLALRTASPITHVTARNNSKLRRNVCVDTKIRLGESGKTQDYCDPVRNDTKLRPLVPKGHDPSQIESVGTRIYDNDGLKRH